MTFYPHNSANNEAAVPKNGNNYSLQKSICNGNHIPEEFIQLTKSSPKEKEKKLSIANDAVSISFPPLLPRRDPRPPS